MEFIFWNPDLKIHKGEQYVQSNCIQRSSHNHSPKKLAGWSTRGY